MQIYIYINIYQLMIALTQMRLLSFVMIYSYVLVDPLMLYLSHTKALTKGPPFCRQESSMRLPEKNRCLPSDFNTRRTLVGNNIVDHSGVGVDPTIHLHSRLNIWLQYISQRQFQDEKRNIQVLGFGAAYIIYLKVYSFHWHVYLWVYMAAATMPWAYTYEIQN